MKNVYYKRILGKWFYKIIYIVISNTYINIFAGKKLVHSSFFCYIGVQKLFSKIGFYTNYCELLNIKYAILMFHNKNIV